MNFTHILYQIPIPIFKAAFYPKIPRLYIVQPAPGNAGGR